MPFKGYGSEQLFSSFSLFTQVQCRRGNGFGDHHNCNGLGDRIFGLFVLFVGAMATKRAFFIDYEIPRPLEDYLEPAIIDWRMASLPKAYHGTVNSAKFPTDTVLPVNVCDYIILVLNGTENNLRMVNNHRTECVVTMMRRWGLYPKGAEAWDARRQQFYAAKVSHRIFHRLFRFSPLVTQAADDVLAKAVAKKSISPTPPSDCWVCIHIRHGQGTGERPRHSSIDNFVTCGQTAWKDSRQSSDQASRCPATPLFAVLVDTATVINTFVGKMNTNTELASAGSVVVSTQELGGVVHFDYIKHQSDTPQSRATLLRIFVDLNILSRCRRLVASLSTFGLVATLIHGAESRRFDMRHHQPCLPTSKNISDWQEDGNS